MNVGVVSVEPQAEVIERHQRQRGQQARHPEAVVKPPLYHIVPKNVAEGDWTGEFIGAISAWI